MASEVPLVPRERPSPPPGTLVPAGRGGPLLVGGEGPPPQEDELRNPDSGSPPLLRCVTVGMGSSPPRSISVGNMVGTGELVTHQSPRDESSVPSHKVVRRHCHQPSSDSDVRQFDGRNLCQQEGGHSLRLPLLVDRATSPMDRVPQCPSGSKVPARAIQCPGRRNQVLGAEWSLHPQVARKLIRTWGSPLLDLFATHLNAKLPLYCSLIPDPQAAFEDAFRHPWNDLDTHEFPPFHLVERVVARVRETPNLLMTLVAPLWPEKPWFADLLLLTQPPLALPLWDRLLCQPHFNRFHEGVHALNLHAW